MSTTIAEIAEAAKEEAKKNLKADIFRIAATASLYSFMLGFFIGFCLSAATIFHHTEARISHAEMLVDDFVSRETMDVGQLSEDDRQARPLTKRELKILGWD